MGGPGARRALALVGLAVLAAAALAGCGRGSGDSKAVYERKVTRAYQVRAEEIGELREADPNDPEYFAAARAAIEDSLGELEEIDPPADVAQAHEAYLQSLRGMIDVLTMLQRCAEEPTQIAVNTCRREIPSDLLQEVENDFDEATAIYRHNGYELPEVPSVLEE